MREIILLYFLATVWFHYVLLFFVIVIVVVAVVHILFWQLFSSCCKVSLWSCSLTQIIVPSLRNPFPLSCHICPITLFCHSSCSLRSLSPCYCPCSIFMTCYSLVYIKKLNIGSFYEREHVVFIFLSLSYVKLI